MLIPSDKPNRMLYTSAFGFYPGAPLPVLSVAREDVLFLRRLQASPVCLYAGALVPTELLSGAVLLMRSMGFLPVNAENRRRSTNPPTPPPMGSPSPIPRRSSMFPLPCRPCHFMRVSPR